MARKPLLRSVSESKTAASPHNFQVILGVIVREGGTRPLLGSQPINTTEAAGLLS